MKVHIIFTVYLTVGMGMSQAQEGQLVPNVSTARVEDGAVTVLHLAPGYTTSVRLPDEISSVVLGDPASFKAEHAEAEGRLVFFKPITSQPAESNAFITTKSGQAISLHLVSAGKGAANAHVDFMVEYRTAPGMLISPERTSFLIADTRPVPPASEADGSLLKQRPDSLALLLAKQKSVSSPAWQGQKVRLALGDSLERNHQTVLSFSVLNDSTRVIELLPPQLELTGAGRRNASRRIKAEPIAIAEYRLTAARLEPGERADGVILFSRPAFKESSETLRLQLTEAEQVDRPTTLPVPFTANAHGDTQ
ncbi:MAG TPA: hypothetical protein VKH81_04420 [Candidatus Angelobacter sp.]|nr:hypothetical protein [Candidatus Angelobacter sp.]